MGGKDTAGHGGDDFGILRFEPGIGEQGAIAGEQSSNARK